MTISQTKSKIVARIWQSIAQSGVAVTAVPQDQMQALVDSIADGVLLAMDETLADAGLPARQEATRGAAINEEEKLLWEGRPFLSLTTLYQVTTERVRIFRGLLSKDRDDIELIRVQDVDHTQSLGERLLNLGDVIVRSADPSLPEATLANIPDPAQVHEIIRRAMLDARKHFRYSVQEEM